MKLGKRKLVLGAETSKKTLVQEESVKSPEHKTEREVQGVSQVSYALPLSMEQFIPAYYEKFSERMFQPSRTRQFLQSECQRRGKKNDINVTLFDGGCFSVSAQQYDQYFAAFARDVQDMKYVTVNEMAINATHVKFAIEMDYRFAMLDLVKPRDFQKHYQKVFEVVEELTERKCSMMVFGCDPKPKFKDSQYVVACGLHLLFDFCTTVETCAQLSHHVKMCMVDTFGVDVVDNMYLNRGKFTLPKLRPPYSCKTMPCITCSDPMFNKLNSRESKSASITCVRCNGNGKLVDTNSYRLMCVLGTQKDASMTIEEQLKRASILGQHPSVGVLTSPLNQKHPMFTIKQLNPNNSHKWIMPSGKEYKPYQSLETRQQLLKGRNRMKQKVRKTDEVMEVLNEIKNAGDEQYQTARISDLTMLGNGYLFVRLGGNGSTYCKVKNMDQNGENGGDFHYGGNRAVFYVIYTQSSKAVYFSCMSDDCCGKMQGIQIPSEFWSRIAALFNGNKFVFE